MLVGRRSIRKPSRAIFRGVTRVRPDDSPECANTRRGRAKEPTYRVVERDHSVVCRLRSLDKVRVLDHGEPVTLAPGSGVNRLTQFSVFRDIVYQNPPARDHG